LIRIDAKAQAVQGYWFDRFQSSTSGYAPAIEEDFKRVFERIEKVERDDVS
jgi:hypothetical protein